MNCAKHPDRPVLDAGVCTMQRCQECQDEAIAAYVDRMIRRDLDKFNDPAQWPAHYDMTNVCRGRAESTASTPKEKKEPK